MSTTPQLGTILINSPQQESLTGVVERLTYHSQESGYSVARLKASGHKDLVTIVGSFPNIQAGQTLKLFGFWREHPKFGSQFTVTQYQETKPATLTGMEKYLGSGLIKGVGLEGAIAAIDTEEQEVTVQFEGRFVTYDYADINELSLAWAVTIHKSQGSEYPVVILPMFMQHYLMLSRNLLYTGLTRAKQLAIIVGPTKAIGLAVRQVKDQERYTLLSERLMSANTRG